MNAIEAVEELVQQDHGILTRESARTLWEAMGLDPRNVPVYAIEHRPNDPKGAKLAGCVVEGEKRIGVGADELAEAACYGLRLKYAPKLGRGSRLRECCRALHEHFSK